MVINDKAAGSSQNERQKGKLCFYCTPLVSGDDEGLKYYMVRRGGKGRKYLTLLEGSDVESSTDMASEA
jgi:hypothetical protein